MDEESGLSYLQCCKSDFLMIPRERRAESGLLDAFVEKRQRRVQERSEATTGGAFNLTRRPRRGRALGEIKDRALYNNDHLLSWCLRPRSGWRDYPSVCDGMYARRWEVDARPVWALNQNPGFVYSVLLSQGPWSPFRLGVSTVYVTLLPPQSALVARCLDPFCPVNR